MRTINVKVKIYDGVKYEADSVKVAEVEYKNIKGFEVITGKAAEEISNELDAYSRDECNEYLIITLENGETATFRNSHTDLFRI